MLLLCGLQVHSTTALFVFKDGDLVNSFAAQIDELGIDMGYARYQS